MNWRVKCRIEYNRVDIEGVEILTERSIVQPLDCGPVWESVERKQRNCIAVDTGADDRHTDQVHGEARLHHITCLHWAVPEHDSIGSCRHRQGEGVGTDDAWRRMYCSFQGHLLGGSGRWGWCTWWWPFWPGLAPTHWPSLCLKPHLLWLPARTHELLSVNPALLTTCYQCK